MVFPQQKRAVNRTTRFAINRKSVSTSQNEGFVEKHDFTGSKNCFYLNVCLKKLKKMVSTSKNKIFLNIGLPLMTIIFSKKYQWKTFVSTKQKICCQWPKIKDWLKINFHETEKLLLMEEIFKKLEQNGFH